MTPKPDLDAGKFSTWLEDTKQAQSSGQGADVPCGECNACCRSSYFIHIKAEEKQTLRRIPKALHFPAPGLPEGHVVLGFDEHGRCPMLVDNKCSIYEDRPQTCRSYDCRIFPAVGIELEQKDKFRILAQTRRWKFDYPTEDDQVAQDALKKASQFLKKNAHHFEPGELPGNETQMAVLAIKIYDIFLENLDGISPSELVYRIRKKLDGYK